MVVVYLDFSLGKREGGRVEIELFGDLSPRACENFRCLCTGEMNVGNQVALHYLNTNIFRVSPGFVIQGGDLFHQGGAGSNAVSIYGGCFNDESFVRRHSQAGCVSMANNGPHSNGSQFFITLKKAPQLDNRHVVVGQVIRGMDVVRAIEHIPLNKNQSPRVIIKIVSCGIATKPASTTHNPYAIVRQQCAKLFDNNNKNTTTTNHTNNKFKGIQALHNAPLLQTNQQTKNTQTNNTQTNNTQTNNTQTNNTQTNNTQTNNIHKNPSSYNTSILQHSQNARDQKLLKIREQIQLSRRNNKSALLEEKKSIADPSYAHKKNAARKALQNKDIPLPKTNQQSEGKNDENVEKKNDKTYDANEEKNEETEDEVKKGKNRNNERKNENNDKNSSGFSEKNENIEKTLSASSEKNDTSFPKNDNFFEKNDNLFGIKPDNDGEDDMSGEEDRKYLQETAAMADFRAEKLRKKKSASFGWNVFNTDALYRAHKKRLGEVKFDEKEYKRQKDELGGEDFYAGADFVGHGNTPSDQAKNRLVEMVEKEKMRKKQFSRRRIFNEDQDVSYISERNRMFNQKLDRSFGLYSAEIQQSLERGTAL